MEFINSPEVPEIGMIEGTHDSIQLHYETSNAASIYF